MPDEKLFTESQMHRLTHLAAVNAQLKTAHNAVGMMATFIGQLAPYLDRTNAHQVELDLLNERVRAMLAQFGEVRVQLSQLTQETFDNPVVPVDPFSAPGAGPYRQSEAPPNT